MKPPVDYLYGSALGSCAIDPGGRIGHPERVGLGLLPMNSLGLRTDSMLDCLERLDLLADPTATRRDDWWETPPAFARDPDEEGGPADEDPGDEEELDDEDFDDDDEDFDDEDFDDDEDDID